MLSPSGRVDFTSKASKRREGIISLDKYLILLSPIVGCADTSPEGGSETTRHSERSEESHRVSEEYIFYGKPPSREIASLRSQRQYIRLVDSSVGYFACAQYDALGLGDCRGTSCLAMTTEKRFSLTLDMT